jgi:hypothetical protein
VRFWKQLNGVDRRVQIGDDGGRIGGKREQIGVLRERDRRGEGMRAVREVHRGERGLRNEADSRGGRLRGGVFRR